MSLDPNSTDNRDYYAARAVEERRQAMAAKEPTVRSIHLEMAERYDRLADGSGAEPRQPPRDKQQAG